MQIIRPRPLEHPQAERPARVEKLRAATYNIWGRHDAWEERRVVLINELRSLQPDVIAFQEAVVTGDYDQVQDLLGGDYFVIHQSGRTPDGVGASIASRWPVGEVREADLHLTPRVDPAVGWIGHVTAAEIQAPALLGTFLFVHHKPSWQFGFERERELQAAASARFIEEVLGEREMHVILAGDFDAVPESASMRFWRGLQSLEGLSVCYADAWDSTHPGEFGHTFTPLNPLVTEGEMPLETGRRIDHILVRCTVFGPTLEVHSRDRILDRAVHGVWASDHFGLYADLAVP